MSDHTDIEHIIPERVREDEEIKRMLEEIEKS